MVRGNRAEAPREASATGTLVQSLTHVVRPILKRGHTQCVYKWHTCAWCSVYKHCFYRYLHI